MEMNSNLDRELVSLDEMPEQVVPIRHPVGLICPSAFHESDLLSHLERTMRLAGEVC